MTTRKRFGLVLGGGGVRGLAHAGVLDTLTRAGVAPDVVVGVSMGAAIASTYAAREDWSSALESIDRRRLPAFTDVREVEGMEMVRGALRSVRQLSNSVWTWGRTGFEQFGRDTMTQLLDGATTFEQTRVPVAVVATDLSAGDRRVFTDGDLVGATLASAAIPGITRPVELDGRLFIDGGFVDPAPIDVARQLGAEVVAAVYTGQHLDDGQEAESWLLALVRGLEIGQRAFAKERLAHADLVLRPHFGEKVRMLNFSALDDCVRCGAESAKLHLDELVSLLEGDAAGRHSARAPAPERTAGDG